MWRSEGILEYPSPPSTLPVTGSHSLLHAPGTPSNSSACCLSPFRDTLESQMCVTVWLDVCSGDPNSNHQRSQRFAN